MYTYTFNVPQHQIACQRCLLNLASGTETQLTPACRRQAFASSSDKTVSQKARVTNRPDRIRHLMLIYPCETSK